MDYPSSSGLVFDVPDYEQAADMPLAFKNFADSISVAGIESKLNVVVRETNNGGTLEINLEDIGEWANKLHVLFPNVSNNPEKLITLNFKFTVSELPVGWHCSFISVEPDWPVTVAFVDGGTVMTTSDSYNPAIGGLVAPYKMCNLLIVPCHGIWCGDPEGPPEDYQSELALLNVAGAYEGGIPTMTYEATNNILSNFNALSSRDGWETKNITRPEDLV